MDSRVYVMAAALCAFAGDPPQARAQANYRMMPIGGRSVLMGSTGVALGADTGVPLLNPAGVLHVHESSIALQTLLVDAHRRTYDDYRLPGARQIELDEPSVGVTRVSFVPSGTCLFEDFGTTDDEHFERERHDGTGRRVPPAQPGRNQLALCMLKSDRWQTHVTADNVSVTNGSDRIDYSTSISTDWKRENYGAAWGIDVTDWLALGASAFAVHSSVRDLSMGSAVFIDTEDNLGRDAAYQSAVTASTWDLAFAVGATVRASDALTLGVSVRPHSIHITDKYRGSAQLRGATTVRQTIDGEFRAPTPTQINLGLGFENRYLRAEIDGLFYLPMDRLVHVQGGRRAQILFDDGTAVLLDVPISATDAAAPVANFAGGVELFVTPGVSVLTGFATDFSAKGDFDGTDGSDGVLSSWRDAYHLSVGGGYYGDFGEIVLGTRLTYAHGRTEAVDVTTEPLSLTYVDETMWGGTLVVAGRLNIGELTKSVKAVVAGEEEKEETSDDDEAESDEAEVTPDDEEDDVR